jgi:hypothetical protein
MREREESSGVIVKTKITIIHVVSVGKVRPRKIIG